jgi:DNA-binding NtrC family response regulator
MSKGRILVIDDEEIIRISCRRALEPLGLRVDVARDGPEALRMLREGSYQVVLTDLKMPGMDGLEVLKEIRHLSPHSRVIVITGYSTTETAVRAMREGAFNYLEKPFSPQALREAVKEALGQ